MIEFDLEKEGVRALNQRLHSLPSDTNERHWIVKNPMGQHAIACGLALPLTMLFFGMINWTHTWFRPEGRVSAESLADMAVELMLGGLGGVRRADR